MTDTSFHILNINCQDLQYAMLCDLKIKLVDSSLNKKYLNHLRTCTRHREKPYYEYFYDLFQNLLLNISQSARYSIEEHLFRMLKNYNRDSCTGLYYILGEFNNFGILKTELSTDEQLTIYLQLELYYNMHDFVNISGMLSNADHIIYSRFISEKQHNSFDNDSDDSYSLKE